MLTFGSVGFTVGASAALALDSSNFASVIHSATAENLLSLLTSPLAQVITMASLGFISQMLMTVLYTVETAAVGTLLQKATGILFSFTFQNGDG